MGGQLGKWRARSSRKVKAKRWEEGRWGGGRGLRRRRKYGLEEGKGGGGEVGAGKG